MGGTHSLQNENQNHSIVQSGKKLRANLQWAIPTSMNRKLCECSRTKAGRLNHIKINLCFYKKWNSYLVITS